MGTIPIITQLRSTLPSIFTRRQFQELSGGIISAGTLANLDSQKKGPGGALVGRATVYEREAFLAWLERRIKGDE